MLNTRGKKTSVIDWCFLGFVKTLAKTFSRDGLAGEIETSGKELSRGFNPG